MSSDQPTGSHRRRRLVAAVELLAVLAGIGVLWVYKPADGGLLRCSFHELTGLQCPGCGATRALWLLAHGHPLLALRYHAPLILILPWLAWHWGRHLADLWRDTPPRPMFDPPKAAVGYGIVIGLVAFWILRNVPVFPLTLLAPPGPLP